MSFNNIKNNFFLIPSILTVVDVILKFFYISLWLDLSRSGLQDKIVWLGIIELICLLFFLIPRTLTIGFFLLCCYWGGQIAINLINQTFDLFSIGMLALIVMATYYMDCPNSIKLTSGNLNQ